MVTRGCIMVDNSVVMVINGVVMTTYGGISKEKKIPMADSIIYASTQKHNATLYTQDEDFKGLPNVKFFKKHP